MEELAEKVELAGKEGQADKDANDGSKEYQVLELALAAYPDMADRMGIHPNPTEDMEAAEDKEALVAADMVF